MRFNRPRLLFQSQPHNWHVNPDFQPFPSRHVSCKYYNRMLSLLTPSMRSFIKSASKITVVIHPAKISLIKNALNPGALWRVIISVPPLFFHTLSDRDVDFINAPREWDSFAQDVSCIIGEDSRKYELGMEVQSRRSWDAGSRLGHGKGVQINISPSQKLLLWSRATSVSALFFMNVSSPSAPAMLPFQRPEQTNVYVKYSF